MTAAALVAIPQDCCGDSTDDYNLALQLYKQDRWERAAAQLERFLSDAPNHEKAPLAKLYLGQSLVHLREFAKARPVFRDFVRSHPEHGEIALAMYRVGECSYFLNDSPQARKELRDFLGKVPADHELAQWALQYLGETELRLGNMSEAASAFEQLLSRFKESPLAEEGRFGLARAYDSLDRTAEAVALYRQVAGNPQSPRAAEAQFSLAARLFRDKQYAEAATEFETVAQRFPQHNLVPLATLNSGFSHFHLREYPAAMGAFAKVEADDKLGRTARFWIALSRKSQGEYEPAGELLISLYREDEQQPLAESLLFHAADCKLRTKAYAEAATLFVDAADRFPNGELADDALHSAIEAALLARDFQQAEGLHDRFAKQFPGSGLELPSDLLYGRVLLARGDTLSAETAGAKAEQAQQAYRQAAETFLRVLETSKLPKTQTVARLHLARAWDRLENYERLIETLDPLAQQALAQDATDEQIRALVMQSNAWLALKNYDRALETAQKYLDRRPQGDDAAEAWANAAIARAHRGEWEPAADAIERLQGRGDPGLTGRISYEIAELAYDQGRWETAQSLYERVLEPGPESEFYVPSVSGLAYSLHESARAALSAAEQAKANGTAIDGTAELSRAISQFDDAAEWFGKLSVLAGRGHDARVQSNAAFMQGLSLKLARRLEPAAELLAAAGQQFSLPKDVSNPSPEQLEAALNAFRAWKEAARTYVVLGQTAQADESYRAAYEELHRQPAEQRGDLDLIVNEWALLHYNTEQFERSDELFRLLIRETPDSKWADDARLLLAESDYFADRFEQARDAFREILSNPATDEFVRKRALLLLVDSAAELEDWKQVSEAAGTLRKLLLEQSPESADRWYLEYRLAEAALRGGEPESAAVQLKSLVDGQSGTSVAEETWFPNVWLMLSEAQLRLKDYASVEQTVTQFKQHNPESPFTYQLDDVLGRRYKNEGRFDESREAFQRVIDSLHGRGTETAAKAQFLIAETFLTQANSFRKEDPARAQQLYDDAFLAYFRVLQYDFPQWQAPALLMAGKCDEALTRSSGAKKSYQQLIADYPQTEYAEQARERLADLERRFPSATTP
ncbi:MAG: tetratricopeptide repeat protein [Planctomycetaceae bacterium]